MDSVGFVLKICMMIIFFDRSYPIVIGSSLHCAVRREISPCTCMVQEPSSRNRKFISVTCMGMTNFEQVVNALKNKFDVDVDISLKISHSALEDLQNLTFQELGITIQILKLNNDNIRFLNTSVFNGLDKTEFLSLSDNLLNEVPQHVLDLMPKIKVLDLSRGYIKEVLSTNFQTLSALHTLLIRENNITLLEKNALPSTLTKLQLGSNNITHLNGTLRGLSYLQWLLLNYNNMEDIDGELPQVIPNDRLVYLSVSHNKLKKLPQSMRHLIALEHVYLHSNQLVSLEGALANCRKLRIINLSENRLNLLTEEDFLELDMLEDLNLGHNDLTSLNNSLLPLKSLKTLNLTHNKMEEFSLQDLKGLTKLNMVDLSYNKIHSISGRMETLIKQNLVELETRVYELRLEYNNLQTLGGSLMGLSGLHRLNLSHNGLSHISPDDLIGLDDLQIMDISYNNLTTLEETSKTELPSLEELIASHNLVTRLEKDFYGLPKLCWAHLGYNKINYISSALADKTHCKLHGVASILRIYLPGNLGICATEVVENIILLESRNNTKVHGLADCPKQK